MTQQPLNLNARAAALCDTIESRCEQLLVESRTCECGTQLYDFGIEAAGSLDAGLLLARICLADLAEVQAIDGDPSLGAKTSIELKTSTPIAACMASQYAGWEVKGEKFFAMGSGPMRAAAGREPLFEGIGFREQADRCVGVLETSKFPPPDVCRNLASKCGIEPDQLILCLATTSSIAGTVQVVARSVETALHKLHELGFDLARVTAGQGSAPLPPVAGDDLAAIGITNDAILYGGRVTLEVTGEDASLEAIGQQLPSSASRDYGKPFAQVLASYDNDFYQVDPLLFSAAQVQVVNLDTGNRFVFGEVNPNVLATSFGEV